MVNQFIEDLLRDNLDFDPTPGQVGLIHSLANFIGTPGENEIFLVKGYAGTGKTTVVNALVKTLNALKLSSVLLAPTGRAAKVLSSYTSLPAYTIHKKIYRQQSGKDGMGNFTLDYNPHKNTFFIVDESSMIGDRSYGLSSFGSGDLLSDLIEYVHNKKKCHLIILGDTAQLPPVGIEISPALEKLKLESMGLTATEVYLRDVVRQALDSGILYNATDIRRKIEEDRIEKPLIRTKDFADIQRVSGVELIEEIENSYNRYSEDETMIISWSNKRANKFNQGIRNQILWRESEISMGDHLMVVKNNYFWKTGDQRIDFIANGDILRIERINGYQDLYGYRFADVTISFLDYEEVEIDAKMMIDTLSIETSSLPVNSQKDFFQKVMMDYEDEKNQKKRIRMVLQNEFFNALQVKFSYAVTCHKAQGGQWKAVFIDPGYYRPEMMSKEYLRWLYTAFTRATEKIFLVNFPDEWFL